MEGIKRMHETSSLIHVTTHLGVVEIAELYKALIILKIMHG